MTLFWSCVDEHAEAKASKMKRIGFNESYWKYSYRHWWHSRRSV